MTELKQRAEEYAITYGIGDNFNVSEFIDFAVKFATEVTKEMQEKITHLERRIASIRGSHRVDVAKLKARTEQVERLKKQNTNLQTMLQAEREVRCNDEYLKKVTELEAQIEKAKEIIKVFLNSSDLNIKQKAEEFLGEF